MPVALGIKTIREGKHAKKAYFLMGKCEKCGDTNAPFKKELDFTKAVKLTQQGKKEAAKKALGKAYCAKHRPKTV